MPSDLYSRWGRRRSGALAGIADLDALVAGADLDDAFDEKAGRMDVVRIDFAGGNEMLDLGHGDLRRRCHHRIEISRGLAVDEVARGIALPGMHDGEGGKQPALHDVSLAVEFLHFLAFGDQGADAGLGIERRNACAPSTAALC